MFIDKVLSQIPIEDFYILRNNILIFLIQNHIKIANKIAIKITGNDLKKVKTIQFCIALTIEKFLFCAAVIFLPSSRLQINGHSRRVYVKLANLTRDLFFRHIHGRPLLDLFSLIGRHPDLTIHFSVAVALVKKRDVEKMYCKLESFCDCSTPIMTFEKINSDLEHDKYSLY